MFLLWLFHKQPTFVHGKIISNMTIDCSNVWAPRYLSLLTAVVAAVFCLVITAGNTIIVALFVINPLKKLRSTFNYFVVNLAVADLIVGSISMPIGIYLHFQEFLKKEAAFHSMEKYFHLTLFVSLTASLLCLIVLSIDRYIAITFPLKYRNNLTWKTFWLSSFVIWVVSLSLPLIYLKTGYIEFLMVYINTAVVIAALTLLTTYIHVYKFLQVQPQQTGEITEARISVFKKMFQQTGVTRVLLWILLLFLACYIPRAIIVYTLQFCTVCSCESIHVMRDVSFYLLTVNSCMNPFVYTFKNKDYRDALIALWTRCRKKMYRQTAIRNTHYGSFTT